VTICRFKLKFEADWGTEGGLEEKVVGGIVLPLMATTRTNMVFKFCEIKWQLIL
jgi:hypothetical protein